MGGEMAVESERGQGSCFYFCIPFKRIHGPVCSRAAKPVSALAPLPRLHVLVAEDDAVSSLLTVRLLEKQGHRTETVVNGEQALASLREKRFDLVLMDVQMPVLDGVQATKAIRKGQAGAGNKHIPIVAMTAYSMAGDSEKFIAAGMDGYVAKPVDVRTLSNVLHTVLKEKSS